jgi:hypothetical protein
MWSNHVPESWEVATPARAAHAMAHRAKLPDRMLREQVNNAVEGVEGEGGRRAAVQVEG